MGWFRGVAEVEVRAGVRDWKNVTSCFPVAVS